MIIEPNINKSESYYISLSALSFTENYQDNPRIVAVSISAGAAIMVYIPGIDGLGYGDDLDYQRWKLSGTTVGLSEDGSEKQFYIYARLSRSEKKAEIIFSLRAYTVTGGYAGGEESDSYWYVRIGYVTAPTNGKRILHYDNGKLGTREAESQKSGMFSLTDSGGTKLIEPLYPFKEINVKNKAAVGSLVMEGGELKSVATDDIDTSIAEQSNEQIATPGFVQEFGKYYHLNKKTELPQEVVGPVTFLADLTVAGKLQATTLEVSGESSFHGTPNIYGTQVFHNSTAFRTEGFIDAAGYIAGAQLTRAGMFTAAGVKTMSLEVFELYYNVIRAQGNTIVLSSAANIDAVKYRVLTDDGYPLDVSPELYYESYSHNTILSVQLMIRKEPTNGNMIPFRRGDILYGYVNKIGNSGQYARSGQCIMEVTSTDEQIDQANSTGALLISAELFAVGTPSPSNPNVVSYNIPPTSGMSIAQRGNTLGTDGRTSCFFIDALEGRLYMLDNVTHPNLFKENYSVLLGKMPSDLFALVQESFSYVGEDDPVVYARYGIFENFLHLDHLGKPIPSSRYRGVWSEEVASGKVPTEDKYTSTNAIYDTVTYDGSLWKCMITGTTDIPSEYSKGWSLLISKGDSFRENLLNNTSQFNLNWALYNKTQIVDGFSGHKGLYRSNRSAGDIAYQYITGNQSVGSDKVSPNEWYTLSFYVKGYTAVSVNIGVMNEDGVITGRVVNEDNNIVVDGVHTSGSSTVVFDVGSEDGWTRHTISFLAAETVSSNAVILFSAPKGSSSITISTPKLELGKEATQWTANANDLSSSIVSELVRYATSDNGTTIPEDGWSVEFPKNVDGRYIWTWTQVAYSTGQETNAYSVSRVGIDGKGISGAVVSYSQQETYIDPTDISDWGDFPAELNDGWWLYTKTETTYSEGILPTTSYTVSQIGTGSYYAGLQEWYAVNNNPADAPQGYPKWDESDAYANGTEIFAGNTELDIDENYWSKARPDFSSEKPYLWNFSVSYDSRENKYVTRPLCIGNFAKGIVSIVESYAISAYSKPNAGGDYPSDIDEKDWGDEHFNAAPTEEKPYQWNRTVTTYNDHTENKPSQLTIYHVSAVKAKDGATPQGNLLKNSDFKKLNAWQSKDGGTFIPAQGEVLLNQVDGVSAFYAERALDSDSVYNYHDVLLQSVTLQPSTWYTLSFYCKGLCKLNTYTYPDVVDTAVNCRVDGVEKRLASDCNVAWEVNNEYAFHYVSFKTVSNISGSKNILFRLIDDASIDNNNIYICKPKLERSEVPTMWSLNESDLIGAGINSVVTKYLVTDVFEQPEPNDNGWSEDKPTFNEGQYLWTKIITDYTDDSIEDTVTISVSRAGKNGDSIRVEEVKYAISNDGAKHPSVESDDWKGSPERGLEEKEYLWTRTKFTDGEYMYTVSRNGDSLKIESIRYSDPTYQASTPEGLDYDREQIPSAVQGQYIWTKITYSDGSVEYYSTYTSVDAGNTYSLVVSPNTVYINKSDELSVPDISVSVLETTPYGIATISGDRLQELGLSVQYLIAGENQRQPFDLGNTFPTDAKYTTVNFFLVHNGEDIFTETVSFPREGKDGNPPISYFAEPAIVNVQIDAQTQKIINNRTENVGVYARTPYGILTEEDYYISLPEVPDGSKVAFGESRYLNNKYYFSVSFADGAKRSEIPTSFSVKFHKADDESVMGEIPITIAISERGLVGGQGASGPMLYPCGRLELGVDYVGLVKLKDGKPAALPIMYYQTTENVEGTYYVLQKDIYAKDNTKENLANTEYWEPFEKYKYIATEFLMANWAKLGSEDGAVFYDRYLFSQKCVDGNGDSVDITDPYTQRDMFDSSGNLTGNAVPNMIFDFKNGLSAVSNSIETYRRRSGSTIYITPETGYNISITPNIPPIGTLSAPSFFANNSIVILPSIDDMGLPEWQINGAHITITFETGGRPYGHTISKITSESMLSRNVFLLVCVDDSCLNDFKVEGEAQDIYATNLHAAPMGYEEDNFIFNRGIRGKYVIMAPGNTLRLRPYIWKDQFYNSHIHWMVDSPNVTEMGLDIYHTAYYLPSYAYKPSNGVNNVTFHNNKTITPYERTSRSTDDTEYWDQYRVYANKTELYGSGSSTEDIYNNLYPDQEEVSPSDRGVCFACGLINLLPDAIVISGFRIENNSESALKEDYRCRAFNSEYDHDEIE